MFVSYLRKQGTDMHVSAESRRWSGNVKLDAVAA